LTVGAGAPERKAEQAQGEDSAHGLSTLRRIHGYRLKRARGIP
jgi:hypothetical protein